ncbi:MAG: TIGR03560 family F420-dependent LLM class oxidoreductase [Candidatus Rokubacteria bacterium]|nr:TIGR03560 family F420-dependent LLM class oxidoreductase [Candidatus Rokubacteria bacterium]
MTFGVHVGHVSSPLGELRKLWRFADTSGFDWFSVSDHFQESPPQGGDMDCFEAISTMTALATETKNVRVGCLVFCVNYRHPGVLAKALCTIDHLSGGRVECGIGAGWHEAEYKAFAIPFERIGVREDQLEEAVQVLRLLFTQRIASFKGQYFQLTDARCNPKPLQKHLRIWIGGLGEKRTLRAAARYADGWNAPYISPEEFKRKSQILDDWCQKAGRDPAEVLRTVNVGFYMGATEKAARRQEERMKAQWGATLQQRIGGFFVGTPQQVIDRVAEYKKAGAVRLNIGLRFPLDWEALHAYVEEVLPAFLPKKKATSKKKPRARSR